MEATPSQQDLHKLTPKRVIQAVVSLAIVVGIFVGILSLFADYDDVWDTIQAMTWLEIVFLLVIGLWNLVTYWFVLTAALPGLRMRQAAVVNQASTAVANTLPGGGAIGVGVTVAMLTSWGFTVAAMARQVVVTGIGNNFVKLGMPVLALALLALEGGVNPARVTAAAIGIGVLVGSVVLLVLVLNSDRLARAIGDGIAIHRQARRDRIAEPRPSMSPVCGAVAITVQVGALADSR